MTTKYDQQIYMEWSEMSYTISPHLNQPLLCAANYFNFRKAIAQGGNSVNSKELWTFFAMTITDIKIVL